MKSTKTQYKFICTFDYIDHKFCLLRHQHGRNPVKSILCSLVSTGRMTIRISKCNSRNKCLYTSKTTYFPLAYVSLSNSNATRDSKLHFMDRGDYLTHGTVSELKSETHD